MSMRRFTGALGLAALLLAGACAPTKVQSVQSYTGPTLPRPLLVVVNDFSTDAADVTLDSGIGGAHDRTLDACPDAAVERDVRGVGREIVDDDEQRSRQCRSGVALDRLNFGRRAGTGEQQGGQSQGSRKPPHRHRNSRTCELRNVEHRTTPILYLYLPDITRCPWRLRDSLSRARPCKPSAPLGSGLPLRSDDEEFLPAPRRPAQPPPPRARGPA